MFRHRVPLLLFITTDRGKQKREFFSRGIENRGSLCGC
jgi:hypothetical protein